MTQGSQRSLWRCPVCGQRFVTRNMPHSCQVVSVEDHFAAAEPGLRDLYDRLLATLREHGPVTVNATKSRIALQARMRFAGIDRPRRDHLVVSFVLTEPLRSARLRRVDYIPPYYYVHRLRLDRVEQIDAELERWLADAHRIGQQQHVTDAGWPKLRRPPDWVKVPREVAEAMARGEDPSTVR